MWRQLAEWFEAGGPVMWPILLLSVVGLTVAVERLFAFAAFFRSPPTATDESTAQAQLNRLQRGFALISTIITAEPMLGILGTVTGIIKTFGAFKLADAASPLAATAGIGEALVTTAAGLIAALVLIFPYNLLLALLARAAAKLEAKQ